MCLLFLQLNEYFTKKTFLRHKKIGILVVLENFKVFAFAFFFIIQRWARYCEIIVHLILDPLQMV